METPEMTSALPSNAKHRGRFQGLQLIMVQCSVCVLVIIVAFIAKAIGGSWYLELSSLFHTAMTEDHVLEGVFLTVAAQSVSDDTARDTQEYAETVSKPLYHAPLIDGVLTSPFGKRTDPITQQSSFHHGVDIAAPENTPLTAIKDGVVKDVGFESGGYGNYILVTCNENTSYLYAHCAEISVNIGDVVSGGDTVALLGNTGRSTGPHVHIEWRTDGVAVDPSSVIDLQNYV